MTSIEFTAAFVHVQKTVRLTQPSGGAGGYQIFIDKVYQGMIVKINGEWVGHLNPASWLTGDDIGVIGEVIESHILR